MAALVSARGLKCSFFKNATSHLCRSQKILPADWIVMRNVLYRSYASSTGKTAAFMMKSSRRDHRRKQKSDNQNADKVRDWVFKNPTRKVRLKLESTHLPSVFSGAESYNPAVIPVYLRMGRRKQNKPGQLLPLRAIGNLNLMRIPNFVHLSPPAIETHCNALKALCTNWPHALDLSTLPLRITTRNYLFAGPSLYHPGSRKVKLQVYLKDLVLDDHARKKMIELVGPRYNPDRDELTIVTDKCPTRQQNRDYAIYLLTVLYYESWKTESWEVGASAAPGDETDDEVTERPRRRRKNAKRVRLLGNSLYRVNQYGKLFRMKIKTKS